MTDPSPPPRLTMTGVRKAFGATVALDGVDLAVHAGEVHGLVGENGAGKSTLMKILAGALPPDRGSMTIDGEPYRPRNPHAGRLAGVAMIYQELSLARHLSVADNVMLGMEPTRWGVVRGGEIRQRVAAALDQLGQADIPPTARVAALSVGQQQMVEIARAVAIGCRVLVLDEPTSSLTRPGVATLFALIRRLKLQGHAIVYISHFLEEVKAITDRITVLRDGRTVGGGDTAGLPVPALVHLMVGRQITDLYPRSTRHRGEPILEVDDLAGLSKPLRAGFTLHRGEVLGIAGLIGAGRTELLRAVFGLDPVRRGTVRLGIHAGAASPVQRWAQGTGLVSEDRQREGLALRLSVADNLTLSRLERIVRPRRQIAAADRWVARLGIKCRDPHQRVLDLSGGNQQKVAIGRLFHHDVDVWLLDEPTRGIDVGSKAQIYRLIDELASAGKAILMVSSYLPELLGVCDRVAVMCRGQLGPSRPVGELTEHGVMAEATGSGETA